jgi:F-type H+-transporting ATPase subunit b
MDKLLELNPGMLIWTFLTFGILLFVLKKYAWKPLLNSLESRENKIASDMERAEKARVESEKLLAEHKVLMDQAGQEARELIAEARKTGERLRDDIVQKAEEQARMVGEQARVEIQREKETALLQLRSEVADLAISAASNIIREELDAKKHQRLVDEFISNLPTN